MTKSTKVFLICSGLGRINRGFESFTQECFDALSSEPEIDLTLFKGGGLPGPKQRVLWNLPRQSWLGEWLRKRIGKTGYWVEQVTFTLSLLPHIARLKPDVLYFSDTNIGNLLWHWRRLTKQKYALLFSNGGPMQPPYPRWDFVQQISPTVAAEAVAAGHSAAKHRLVPYGFRMPPLLEPSSDEARAKRAALGLPEGHIVILSVGAVNSSQKNMDYLVREMAALPSPQPFLLLVGQQDDETPQIAELAAHLLGPDGFAIKTVPHEQMPECYEVADVFVLASLHEGFGRVFVEALSHGLPCLAHDYPQSRDLLGDTGGFADFTQTGRLTALFCQIVAEADSEDADRKRRRHQSVYDRFSWEKLRPTYVAMIQHCANPTSAEV